MLKAVVIEKYTVLPTKRRHEIIAMHPPRSVFLALGVVGRARDRREEKHREHTNVVVVRYYSSKVDDDDDDASSSTTTTTTILDQISGAARPDDCCVLGPSGSGKTTFLNALSGRLKDEKNEVKARDDGHGRKEEHPTCAARKEASFKTPFARCCALCFFSGRVRKNERTTGELFSKNSLSDALSSS